MHLNPAKIAPAPDSALIVAKSDLTLALERLSVLAKGMGACLCLEHATEGVTVISDLAWQGNTSDTLHKRQGQAVFDLRGHEGYDRISVLVGVGDRSSFDALMQDCDVAAAAIDVLSALIGASPSPVKTDAPLRLAA